MTKLNAVKRAQKIRYLPNNKVTGYLATLIAIALLATVEVCTKLIQMNITPYQINFFRTMFGDILILSVLLVSGGGLINFIRRNFTRVIVTALLWNTIGLNIYFLSVTLTSASHAALIFSSFPIVVSVLAVVTLHEQITWRRTIGALLGFIGIAAVITKFDYNFLNYGTVQGDFLMIIPLILWSLYTIWGLSRTSANGHHRYSPYREQLNYLCSTLTFGLIFMVPLVVLDVSRNSLQLTGETLVPLIYLGITTNGIAYILYFWGISRLSISKGVIMFFLKPLLAAIFSFLLLGENIFSPSFIIGTLLIFIGISIVVRS